MATTLRSSVPKTEPTTSKPRARSDALAKAGKAKRTVVPAAVKPALKPKFAGSDPARAPKATREVAAAASSPPVGITTKADGLLDSERTFANAYLLDPNGASAYKTVHPHVKDATAATEAWKLLRKPKGAGYLPEGCCV